MMTQEIALSNGRFVCPGKREFYLSRSCSRRIFPIGYVVWTTKIN